MKKSILLALLIPYSTCASDVAGTACIVLLGGAWCCGVVSVGAAIPMLFGCCPTCCVRYGDACYQECKCEECKCKECVGDCFKQFCQLRNQQNSAAHGSNETTLLIESQPVLLRSVGAPLIIRPTPVRVGQLGAEQLQGFKSLEDLPE